ncbi:uncharacterized protein LOC127867201 [Dreissena polymorpha]|nr:uncharacterized protein LOC127867201 [Dreissena polymorpha]
MFVVFETNKWWWTIEKHSDVITIQRSRIATNVKEVCKQKSRIKGHRRMFRGRGTCSVNELLDWLHGQLNKKYNFMRRNCQHFATDVFMKLTDTWRGSTEIKEFFAILVNRSEETLDSISSFSSKSGSEFQSTTYADLRTGTGFHPEASSTPVPNDEDTHDTHDEHDDMGLLNLNEIVREISEESETPGLDGIDVALTSLYLEDASTPVPNDEHDTHDEHDDMGLLNLNEIVQETAVESETVGLDRLDVTMTSFYLEDASTPVPNDEHDTHDERVLGSLNLIEIEQKTTEDIEEYFCDEDETTGDVQSIPARADERTEQLRELMMMVTRSHLTSMLRRGPRDISRIPRFSTHECNSNQVDQKRQEVQEEEKQNSMSQLLKM